MNAGIKIESGIVDSFKSLAYSLRVRQGLCTLEHGEALSDLRKFMIIEEVILAKNKRDNITVD